MVLFACLFVHSIYIPSSTSHSLIDDSEREHLWIHSSSRLLWINNIMMSLLSPLQGERRQKLGCTYTLRRCVFVLTMLKKARHVRNFFWCALYTVQCLCVQIMLLTCRVYISLMGVSESLQSCCSLYVLCSVCKHWFGPTTKIDTLSLTNYIT